MNDELNQIPEAMTPEEVEQFKAAAESIEPMNEQEIHEFMADPARKRVDAAFTQDLNDEAARIFLASKRLGMDTETRGLHLHRDRLCAVQLANNYGDYAVVFVDKPHPTTKKIIAPNLRDVVGSAIPKVFHYARFDVARLLHYLGPVGGEIFCTKIASKLVRTVASSHSLAPLLQEMLGVKLDKTQQQSDWGVPASITAEQLEYAKEDTIHLLPLQEALMYRAGQESRRLVELILQTCDLGARAALLDVAFFSPEEVIGH